MLIELAALLRIVDLVDAALDIAEDLVDALLPEQNVPPEGVDVAEGLAEQFLDDALPDLAEIPDVVHEVIKLVLLIQLSLLE